MIRTWTDEQKQFLRDNYGRMSYTDIAVAIGKPVAHIKSQASNLKITVTRKWPDEHDRILRDLYADTPTQAIADQLGRHLSAVYARAKRLGLCKSEEFLKSPLSGRLTAENAEERGGHSRFQKGQDSWNKGKKIANVHPNSKATQFQKNQTPHNHVPVGTEVVASIGFLKIKVAEPNVWEFSHQRLWREHHGEIPESSMIAFLDGDRMNCVIENLECVSKAEWMKRHTIHNYPEDLKAAIRALAGVKRRLNSYAEKQNRRSTEFAV